MSRALYFSGHTQYGQSGRFLDENVQSPSAIELSPMRYVSAGGKHINAISGSLINSRLSVPCPSLLNECIEEGLLYSWGDNEFGQLGRSAQCKPNRVPALETFDTIMCASGDNYSVAITADGHLLAWGCGGSGQLGVDLEDENSSRKPKVVKVKGAENTKFVYVAVGKNSSFAVTEGGQVYSWGANWNGQLGRGDFLTQKVPDHPISGLLTLPITMVTCGESHTLFLTLSGELYACGSNRFGELGFDDEKSRPRPVRVVLPARVNLVAIACGSFHSLAISHDHQLYSWGSNSHGQLGRSDVHSHRLPALVDGMNGMHVLQVAAGSRHSVATVLSEDGLSHHVVYTWGNGSSGQLGHGDTRSQSVPKLVTSVCSLSCTSISCGAEFTLFDMENPKGSSDAVAQVNMASLQLGDIRRLGEEDIKHLHSKIQTVFSSPACLNGSFLESECGSPAHHYYTNAHSISGLNMEHVREAFTALVQLYEEHASLMTVLANATGRLVQNLANYDFNSPASLRMFLILIEVPWMLQPVQYNVVLEKLTRAIVGLTEKPKEILRRWWTHLPRVYALRILKVFRGYLGFLISNSSIDTTVVSSVVLVLDLLHQATHRGKQISHGEFAQPLIGQYINLRQDFEHWAFSSARVFAFCHYPFLLDVEAKQKLLDIEAHLLMQVMMVQALQQMTEPLLILTVHRNRVFEDTMNELINYISGLPEFPPSHLKKPLRVTFLGEDGVDDGGLRRELFYLLMDHVFNPDHGLFIIDPDSFYSWFAPPSRHANKEEATVQYKLVGILLGMAIYNGIILNIRFPRAVYRKLMDKDIRLNELQQFHPSVAESLSHLKTMTPQQLQEADLTFQIVCQDEVQNLCEGGADIAVTEENLDRYIELYGQHVLYNSVKTSFDAMKEGFWLTCNGKAMNLLHPEELETLVSGSEKLDFHELEKVTHYEGYSVKSLVVQWFWEVVHEWNYETKRQFLLFTTGTPRAPVLGLSRMKFTIQRAGTDSQRLPVAHTCYNILDLPEYQSKEIVQQRLATAVENFQGFGLR